MAEFVEVMRQARRMCQTHEACEMCDFKDDYGCAFIPSACSDFAGAERDVMLWAKMHPEPVYPSWKAWQEKNFPDAASMICPQTFGGECQYLDMPCPECVERPIPAEIAEKLGIVPTNGTGK